LLAAVAYSVQTRRTEIAKRKRAEKANDVRWHDVASLEDNVTTKDEPTERTRAAVAKEFGVPERKLRDMQEISKHSPAAVAAIRGEPRHNRARRAIRPRR